MTYFHTDDPATVNYLAGVAALASEQSQSLRIDVDDAGRLIVKRGHGVWSAPIRSTHDDYRDLSQQAKVDELPRVETVRLCTGCQGDDHDHSVCGA